ncbi:hypothetical protein [Rhodopseudomonas sp. B29]|uniref:hypothetical protein n=1 Tax=Rhodopseudomonas sp. B29 TaxID=95607 RepID=UPI0011D2AFCF|nr:hypothetical protein [Rhodopseudomonas sp. B29]
MKFVVVAAQALALLSAAAAAAAAQAQTPSGDVGGRKSCSQLVAECIDFNKKGGYDTGRCAGYKDACMASGIYQDRNRTIINVRRK